MVRQTRKQRYSPEVLREILGQNFWKNQRGGALIHGNGVPYDYRAERNGSTVVFRGGREAGKQECFLLIVYPDGEAILQSLKQSATCAFKISGTARSMVKAAVALAKKKGAKTLELTDLSTKKLTDELSFRLSNMYFLTSGRTWYESILPGLYPLSEVNNIPKWRKQVNENTWAHVSSRLPAYVKMPVDISDVDIYAPGSAMVVLNRIKQAGAPFFADYDAELVSASGIGSLYGIAWKMSL